MAGLAPYLTAINTLVGLGTPVCFAFAIYHLFAWADRKASASLKRAISGWLKREAYQRVDWRSAIVGLMFDRLYTHPLLRPTAFLRSATVSILVFTGFVFISSSLFSYDAVAIAAPYLVSVVISDYISLFVVRRSLLRSNNHPMKSLLLAFLIGSIVIVIAFFCGLKIQELAITSPVYLVISSKYPLPIPYSIGRGTTIFPVLNLFIPALLIHFWLILFAAGAILASLLYRFFQTVAWAQWALKQGNRHPLQAIGLVAAALFVAAAALWRVLSALW